jgi:lipopolysaccharide transport system permease protein
LAREQIILEKGRADRQYWRDMLNFRELLIQLAKRDISVHYKQTIIGGLWALIKPLLTVVILTVVFSMVAKLQPENGIWYPLYTLAAMIPWQFFATILGESSNSLVSNSNLISKVYFPRMLVPFSTIGVPLVDLVVILPVLAAIMLFTKSVPPVQIVLAPLFIILAALAAIGSGLWLCALNVKYRDVRYVIPFILQFGVYLSPIGYPTSRVPEHLQWLYHLNPMVFVIDGMRWCLVDGRNPFVGGYWLVSVAVIIFMLLVGVKYFRKTEKTFADLI